MESTSITGTRPRQSRSIHESNQRITEKEREERKELLRHLRGQRTQALPKHSLFGTRTPHSNTIPVESSPREKLEYREK